MLDDEEIEEELKEIAELRERIRHAFRNSTPPGPEQADIAAHRCEECDEVVEDFQGRTWQEVSLDTLFNHRLSLSLFTPQAFAYFIPAYMVGSLDLDEAYLRQDTTETPISNDLSEYICYNLSRLPTSESDQAWYLARVLLFDKEQIEVIIDYLNSVCDADEYAAVQEFWQPRLESLTNS